MDAAAAHSENSRNGKQIAACESSPTSLSSNAILSYRMGVMPLLSKYAVMGYRLMVDRFSSFMLIKH